MRYYIYCDESVLRGRLFSDFYGGLIIDSRIAGLLIPLLQDKFAELGLTGEVKWTKTNEFLLSAYQDLIDYFFDFVDAGHIKVRIMFTQNLHAPGAALTTYQRQHQYHLLYYQFLKHAFGLQYMPVPLEGANHLELFFDKLPDKEAKNQIFKNYLLRLPQQPEFQNVGIQIAADAIGEVDSSHHPLLQCLDVVLGAMAFRLNKQHLEIPPGKRHRGKRTLAKEKLYKHIHKRIVALYPRFNIGASTGRPTPEASWEQPYRHWNFHRQTPTGQLPAPEETT
ncbi:DUF3800 domain-containing protein [Hymenobacter sp. BT523]|uniref:DUF3800 domain-containing protein n=1 Tax=Hymenobacter sp. BT523 TaxID=2795725 RepID=UPI0018EA3380|nr:DUF3800 domain-containing protein [Hymenobacter sp. BT523]MBJ6111829.1 DUF3800 domain-containing protein [Hymenobacter sp. BT523]